MRTRPVSMLALTILVFAVILGADRRRADVERMTDAAQAFLGGLSDAQRAAASFPLDSDERLRFHFIPPEMFERRGVVLSDLSADQRAGAEALLRSGLSQRGYMTATQIMELEDVLLALEGGRRFARAKDEYYVSVFGTPARGATWAWRFEGHHLSLHFTVVEGRVGVFSPAFAGANPADVREGPQQGRRALGEREDAGRALARALASTGRLDDATIAAEAPRDIVTGAEADVDPLEPAGLAYRDMGPQARAVLVDLIDVYLSMMSDELAASRRAAIHASGLDDVTFGWAGGVERGEPHYYRVQGPSFLIEYDNTQNDANHIHSVWRDFDGDFGRDLLREHRAQHPHD